MRAVSCMLLQLRKEVIFFIRWSPLLVYISSVHDALLGLMLGRANAQNELNAAGTNSFLFFYFSRVHHVLCIMYHVLVMALAFEPDRKGLIDTP